MFTALQSLYTSSRGLRILIGIGLIASGILLVAFMGGFPPWSWRLSAQVLSTLPALWAIHGFAMVVPLFGLILNSLLCLILWIGWLTTLIKIMQYEWKHVGERQQFEQDVQEAEQMAQRMAARGPNNQIAQGTIRTPAYAAKKIPNHPAYADIADAPRPQLEPLLDDLGYTKTPSSARRYPIPSAPATQLNVSDQVVATTSTIPARASARSVAVQDYAPATSPVPQGRHEVASERSKPLIHYLEEDEIDGNDHYQEEDEINDAVQFFETPSEMKALQGATRLRLVVGLGSDPGLARKDAPNEDNLLALQGTHVTEDGLLPVGLFVVADGMGGHSNGQEASRIAIRSMSEVVAPVLLHSKAEEELCEELLKDGVQRANLAIYQRNHQEQHMMGTTITAILLFGSMAHIVNVGDSRTYLYRKSSGLSQITRDHSVVGRLVEEGALTREALYTHPSRNQIYRCLGEQVSAELDSFGVPLQANDVLLLCSDGLWEMVRDQEIASIVSSNNPQASQISSELIAAALRNGGADNVSVVVVCIV